MKERVDTLVPEPMLCDSRSDDVCAFPWGSVLLQDTGAAKSRDYAKHWARTSRFLITKATTDLPEDEKEMVRALLYRK